MTIKEALLAQASFLHQVPEGTLAFQLTEVDLDADADYNPVQDRKKLDLALAGLFLFVATQPVSIKELDWGITNISVADLLHLRRGLLKKWGIDDDMSGQPTIQSVSLW